jgi:SOS-response transcriptional repressor LexA
MLTETLKRTMGLLESYVATNGQAPTLAELCDLLGLTSRSGIHRRLRGLELRGHIKIEPGVARGITICRACQFAFYKWDANQKVLVEMESPRAVRSRRGSHVEPGSVGETKGPVPGNV